MLATFGFCLPDKGFLELIYAVDLLRKSGFNIYLNMYISIHQSELSLHTLKNIEELVLQLNLTKFIFINSDFLEQSTILNNLSNCEAVVFPYQRSNESSSAAIRLGIASRCLVFATPLSVFSDVSNCVQTFSDTTIASIVKGLTEWILKSDKKSFLSNLELRNTWIEQHQFYKLSQRLKGIIKSIEINS